jgi:hypothetical protein
LPGARLHPVKIGPGLFPGRSVTRYPQDVPRRRTLAAAILLAALALSGCATSKSAASVTEPPVVATLPSMSAPSATRPEPTTTATAASTTTVAPTTIVAAAATTVAQVPLATLIQRAIQKNGVDDFVTCVSDPSACDPARFTTTQGTYRQTLIATAKQYANKGERGKTNTADPSYVVVRSAGLDTDGTLATAKVCMWDTLIVYRPGGTTDGPDTIVDSDKASAEMSYIMVLENGVWLVANAQTISEDLKGNTCPARP